MSLFYFLNGEVVPAEEAKVSVMDIGLLRGYGLYDGLSVINGKVRHFSDHWDRFVNGAKVLELKIPITKDLLEEKIVEIAEKSGLSKRANVRLILTGGETLNGIEYDFDKPTFYATVGKWQPMPEKYFKEGAKLITYEYQRELPEIKTINYIKGVGLQKMRKKEGAVEILYTHNGLVLECATSNIFLVKDGVILTPKSDILGGITRKIVLDLIKGHYPVGERNVRQDELRTADEVFITSSFKDVVPVSKINDFMVGDGGVGEVTKDVVEKFAKYIS